MDVRQLSLNYQLYPDGAESHKIINHPVHIFDQTLGYLSPSSFIPFCDFGGNRQEMGIKIKQFYSPICNSFHVKILNYNLCYEVDPNRFIDSQDPWAMSKGLTLFIDTNLERQYPRGKSTKGMLSSFSTCIVSLFSLLIGQNFMIYLSTLGRFTLLTVLFTCVIIAPLKLYGSGLYALSAVKDIVVTKSFLGLNRDIRKCQHREIYEDCTSNYFYKMLQDTCNCTLYALRNFSRLDQVRTRYAQSLIKSSLISILAHLFN